MDECVVAQHKVEEETTPTPLTGLSHPELVVCGVVGVFFIIAVLKGMVIRFWIAEEGSNKERKETPLRKRRTPKRKMNREYEEVPLGLEESVPPTLPVEEHQDDFDLFDDNIWCASPPMKRDL